MRPLLCLLAATLASLSFSCKDPPAPPPPPECGNGLIELDEQCEGLPPPTGCDADSCTIQMGWVCTPEVPGPDDATGGNTSVLGMEWTSTCEKLETCGDGVIDPEEDCDDGDMAVSDGCSGCRIDPQYICEGEPSVCHTCGDGFRNPEEQCDDGELIGMGSAGCENCLIVPGWDCFPGDSADLCGPTCGDGMWFDTSIPGVTIGFAEQCDDGNLVDGDGCNGNCNIEAGWVCDATAPETSVCIIPEESSGTDTETSSSSGPGSSSGSGSTGSGSTGSTGSTGV